jgi:hypothetical protein
VTLSWLPLPKRQIALTQCSLCPSIPASTCVRCPGSANADIMFFRACTTSSLKGKSRSHCFSQLGLHIGYVYGATKPPAHASHYTSLCPSIPASTCVRCPGSANADIMFFRACTTSSTGASYWICVWSYQAACSCFPLYSEICAWGALASCYIIEMLPLSFNTSLNLCTLSRIRQR